MYTQPKEGGHIVLVHSFVSVHYLLNQWMDFDGTCIVTSLGGRKELIRFW